MLSRPGTSLFLKAIITVSCLFYLFWVFPIDLHSMMGLLASLSFFFATVLVLIGLCFGALRWYLVIKASSALLDMKSSIILTLIGHFFNQVLPTSIGGDAVKVYKLHKQGMDLNVSVVSVFFDRFYGLCALVLLLAVSAFYLVLMLDAFSEAYLYTGCAIFALLGGGLFACKPVVSRKLPVLNKKITLFITDYRKVLSVQVILQAVTWSLLSHIVFFYLIVIFTSELGYLVDFFTALLIFPAVVFISSLPVSIAGWGLREVGMAAGFVYLGLPAEVGVSVSIMIGLSNLAVGFLGCIFWWSYRV